MSSRLLENLDVRLSEKTKAVLLRIAQKIALGWDGEIQMAVDKNGGVRYVKWIQTETGESIKEDLG